MARSGLEEKLETITRAFIAQLVEAIRGASFAEVAELQIGTGPKARATRVTAAPRAATKASAALTQGGRDAGRLRQTADRRAELADRVVTALEQSGQPMSARALSSELGIAPDLLAVPLRELRAAGRIAKHGEKRATTYSVA